MLVGVLGASLLGNLLSGKGCCNLGHNILRLFDVLPNVSFTSSETNCDYL